jgi:hypothetical protein
MRAALDSLVRLHLDIGSLRSGRVLEDAQNSDLGAVQSLVGCRFTYLPRGFTT